MLWDGSRWVSLPKKRKIKLKLHGSQAASGKDEDVA
jgi:hypothetical protein